MMDQQYNKYIPSQTNALRLIGNWHALQRMDALANDPFTKQCSCWGGGEGENLFSCRSCNLLTKILPRCKEGVLLVVIDSASEESISCAGLYWKLRGNDDDIGLLLLLCTLSLSGCWCWWISVLYEALLTIHGWSNNSRAVGLSLGLLRKHSCKKSIIS